MAKQVNFSLVGSSLKVLISFSFTAPPGGGTVTCNSDTDCQLVPKQ
jgi:hypothetical protein